MIPFPGVANFFVVLLDAGVELDGGVGSGVSFDGEAIFMIPQIHEQVKFRDFLLGEGDVGDFDEGEVLGKVFFVGEEERLLFRLFLLIQRFHLNNTNLRCHHSI